MKSRTYKKEKIANIPEIDGEIQVFAKTAYFRRFIIRGTCKCGRKFKKHPKEHVIYICTRCTAIYKFIRQEIKESWKTAGWRELGKLQRIKHLPHNLWMLKSEWKVSIVSF
jgi:hypothetical protein